LHDKYKILVINDKGLDMKNKKNAFTMIELVFVIVVLGILAAVAIPKFAATRTDAEIAKARTDISSIRSAIVTERQSRIITGDSSWIPRLSTGVAGDNLFTGVDVNQTLLMYGIAAGEEWANTATDVNTSDTYTFTISGTTTTFQYNATNATATIGGISVPAGAFTCSTTAGTDAEDTLCENLIK